MMVGEPRDFDELVQQLGRVIDAVESPDTPQVARHLWHRGALRNYRAPLFVTLEQAQEYCGVSATLWRYAMQQPSKRKGLPVPVEGDMTDPKSRYCFADVKAFFARRAEVFPALARRCGFKPCRLPEYAAFLIREARKILDELKVGYVFDLPAHLPQNDAELYETYSLTVVQVVRRRVKYGLSIDDAIQQVWCKLLDSTVLIKFMRSGPNRLPTNLTTEETLDFLGVDWAAWQQMMGEYEHAPNPVKGASSSMSAVYRSEHIVVLANSGYFRQTRDRRLPASAVSREMLNRYVKCAAENKLKNIFRSQERHCNREDMLQDGAYITENRSVRVRRDVAPGHCWEDSLRSEEMPADQVCELKERLGIAGQVLEVFTALAD